MGGSAGNVFAESGPTHMMTKIGAASSPTTVEIDWNNEEHRRCITACLVKGTYILEKEHQIKRTEGKLATAWWEKFHFRLHHVLEFECNCVCCKERRRIFRDDQITRSFVYGAVFEYVPPEDAKNRHPSAPHYVVAFRGTMPQNATVFSDMLLNLRVLLNMQRHCGRFKDARRHVASLLGSTPPAAAGAAGGGRAVAGGATSSNPVVWLAGHSLGASIALHVGRDMMTTGGGNLPTFLFNPPHVSAAPLIDAVMSEQAKRGLYKSSYVLKCALGVSIAILSSHKKHMEELFKQLSPWVPNLYVHRWDAICMGFIDYFEQREQVKEWSACVANSAATLSYRDMAYSVFHQHSERQHLLPCAVLWTSSHGDDPHGLQQWWQPELYLKRDQYSWP